MTGWEVQILVLAGILVLAFALNPYKTTLYIAWFFYSLYLYLVYAPIRFLCFTVVNFFKEAKEANNA